MAAVFPRGFDWESWVCPARAGVSSAVIRFLRRGVVFERLPIATDDFGQVLSLREPAFKRVRGALALHLLDRSRSAKRGGARPVSRSGDK